MYKNSTRFICRPWPYIYKFLLVMKLTTAILLAAIMQVSAKGFAQRLTLDQGNVSLSYVFKEIRKQTGYNVLWKPDKVNVSNVIAVNFKNTSLNQVMEQCLSGQNLTYTIDEKTIIIKPALQKFATEQEVITVRGRVIDKTTRMPLVGVHIASLKDNKIGSSTNDQGEFEIKVLANSSLLVKMMGYKEVVVSAKNALIIEM